MPITRGEKVIDRFQAYGILDESTDVQILRETLGLTFFEFKRGFIAAILKGQSDKISRYTQLYESRTGTKLRGLRVEARPWIISRSGFTQLKPEVFALRYRDPVTGYWKDDLQQMESK